MHGQMPLDRLPPYAEAGRILTGFGFAGGAADPRWSGDQASSIDAARKSLGQVFPAGRLHVEARGTGPIPVAFWSPSSGMPNGVEPTHQDLGNRSGCIAGRAPGHGQAAVYLEVQNRVDGVHSGRLGSRSERRHHEVTNKAGSGV